MNAYLEERGEGERKKRRGKEEKRKSEGRGKRGEKEYRQQVIPRFFL